MLGGPVSVLKAKYSMLVKIVLTLFSDLHGKFLVLSADQNTNGPCSRIGLSNIRVTGPRPCHLQ